MKIGFTNGCYDILHLGHIGLLNFCKSHGFLIAFPFIVYLLKRTFGKPAGWFSGYNEIIFLNSSLIDGVGVFFHAFQRNLFGTIKELDRKE